jgi:hypothetical protein
VKYKGVVANGTLVSELTFSGNDVTKPDSHVVYFVGDYPCDADGNPLKQIFNSSQQQELTKGLTVDHTFSAKPQGRDFQDYYDKMSTYAAMLSGPAEIVDPSYALRCFPVAEADETESVFRYVDTASSRAEIDAISSKLERGRVAIVGLGGTGSYVLDLVAKTPVKEIHLFDGDLFLQHNAFRSPGAPSIEELKARHGKAKYWAEKYGRMHRHVHAHEHFISEANAGELAGMDFLFLCLDRGTAKKSIIRILEEHHREFIDVGAGIAVKDDTLTGIVRVTTSTPARRDHVPSRVSLGDLEEHNEYSRNIQVADLNALNAALAVIKWKKLWGFYLDLEREHNALYMINGNMIINEDNVA